MNRENGCYLSKSWKPLISSTSHSPQFSAYHTHLWPLPSSLILAQLALLRSRHSCSSPVSYWFILVSWKSQCELLGCLLSSFLFLYDPAFLQATCNACCLLYAIFFGLLSNPADRSWHFSSKCQLSFSRLVGIVSQKIFSVLFLSYSRCYTNASAVLRRHAFLKHTLICNFRKTVNTCFFPHYNLRWILVTKTWSKYTWSWSCSSSRSAVKAMKLIILQCMHVILKLHVILHWI
jgi:hypothetical protein